MKELFNNYCLMDCAMEIPRYCATLSQSSNPMATHGMVTTPHYLATQAGIDILRKGGNAVDAAIAAAVTLTVVSPHMCTPGGDNFWLIFNFPCPMVFHQYRYFR